MRKRLNWLVCVAVGSALIGLLALAGCTPQTAPTATTQPETTPDSTPAAPSTAPAVVDNLELLIMESFPVQINAIASGNLPDGCTTIDSIAQARAADRFTITITTQSDPLALCTEALVPFQEIISLDVAGLPAGNYVVDANGVTQTFTLSVDNVLATPEPTAEPTPEPTGFTLTGLVFHDLCAIAGGEGGEPAVPSEGCVSFGDGSFVANGTLDEGEPGLSDVSVVLRSGACPGTEQVASTGSDGEGNFSLTQIAAGTYCVTVPVETDPNAAILIPGSWTTPNVDGAITVEVGGDTTIAPFGWDYQFLPVPERPVQTLDNRPAVYTNCIDLLAFGGDVTIPDDTPFEPGSPFTKTWQLINSGGCTWGVGYELQFVSGEQMGAPATVPITRPVGSGERINVSVPFIAPQEQGPYRSDWLLRRPDDVLLSPGDAADASIWVQIVVVEAGTLGSISGFVWNDICNSTLYTFGTPSLPAGCLENSNGTVRGDGVYDPISENRIAGVTVTLGTGVCGDATEIATTTSDGQGRYRFASLLPETYCVYVDVVRPENFELLVPGNFTFPLPGRAGSTIVINGGDSFESVNFGWDYAETVE